MPNQSGQVYGLTVLSPIIEDDSIDIGHQLVVKRADLELPLDSN